MRLQQAVNQTFLQLSDSLRKINSEEYTRPCVNLSNSTIGHHVRHIIEMFQCLEKGYHSGIVNYENRKRDIRIETDKELAREILRRISNSLDKINKELQLEGEYNYDENELLYFPTNYYREIVYNLEHTIHHMALIRIGFNELGSIELPESFGVAAATVKHRRSCAQ